MTSASAMPLSPDFLAQLERLELVSRKILRGRLKGERRSVRKGQSVEFTDFRSYAAGDDLRFIDWNTYARLDRLFLKMFLEEEDLHFHALVDDSRSMNFGTPTKFDYARQLAAALGFVGLIRGDRVQIDFLNGSAGRGAPAFRGRRSVWRMLGHVSAYQPTASTALADGVKQFCIRNPRQGIVVLISDLLDKQGYADALKVLLSRGMDVYAVHVLSAEELDPDLRGDLKLIDCEDGDVAEITASAPLVARYQKTLAAFAEQAREFCSRRGINYVPADNQLPLERLVSNLLHKRGLVQ